ncbi:MAG: hypothetical protein HZB14_03520 [Actinobacteria bacterium]|nr:hypothetical protein [Actinomycetota bacterium]
MGSERIQIHAFPRAAAALTALLCVLALCLVAFAGDASAAKVKKSASATKKLPVVTRVSPMEVDIGKKLTISGKYIVKGTNKMRVLFQRVDSTRRFSARAKGLSSKSLSVIVPDVSSDVPDGASAIFRIRLISKYGTSKVWTKASISPSIRVSSSSEDTGATGDCDRDGLINSVDLDDDNDLLDDVSEKVIGTLACVADTDGDGPTDYYEHRVSLERNNGLADRLQTVPYPLLDTYPNPTVGDDTLDLDGDKLTMRDEFDAWQYTGRMDRFYSDADQDSDGDGVFDDLEDEDLDLLPNIVEILSFAGAFPLQWLKTDSDGDGLCDGLDDQDQDGPPVAASEADCATVVPNVALNGPGDPNPLLIDGDDNRYGNWYEWAYNGASSWYDPCNPSSFPTSPSCPHP